MGQNAPVISAREDVPQHGRWALAVGAHTDRGRVRTANEDAILASAPYFAVADGLGGRVAGNVASTIVTATIAELIGRRPATPEALREMVVEANARLRAAGRADAGLAGMGSTCTLALVADELHVAHVGDSRAYCLRGGALAQLTADHSMVAELVRAGRLTPDEARADHSRNVILRALGAADDVDVDVTRHLLRDADRLLLCSDGLTGMLRDEIMRELLGSIADPQEAAHALVDAANMAGGVDNVSAVVVDVRAISG